MGFQAMLGAVVAVVVGGIGSIEGAFVGSLFVGIVQSFAAWPLPSEWQDTVLFVILVVFLLWRPQGFFGRTLSR
jgi:branched-chain amino acid transport system permease protein